MALSLLGSCVATTANSSPPRRATLFSLPPRGYQRFTDSGGNNATKDIRDCYPAVSEIHGSLITDHFITDHHLITGCFFADGGQEVTG